MIRLYKKYREIINYVIVGALTTIVSLGSYYFCVFLFLNPRNPLELQIANIISWICAVSFAYITNRKYVFESKETEKIYEALRFVGSRISTLIIDMICMAAFVSLLKLNDKINKIMVQFIVFSLNYLFSKFFVFRHKRSTN